MSGPPSNTPTQASQVERGGPFTTPTDSKIHDLAFPAVPSQGGIGSRSYGVSKRRSVVRRCRQPTLVDWLYV